MEMEDSTRSSCDQLDLPGFRFHPTEEELLNFYLKSMVVGRKFPCNIIGFLNIYNYDPRDLPGLAKIGEREWYFFVPRDRKHGSGGRPNRTTETGFWKATGSDRKIFSTSEPKKVLGLRKTLVFYEGRAPHGSKTHWVMNEYRLPDKSSPKDIVLCKIYMKATSLKVLEQRAAMEEDNFNIRTSSSSPPIAAAAAADEGLFKKETSEDVMFTNDEDSSSTGGIMLPHNLADLQVPKLTMDWTQDSFWTQLSPWLDNFSFTYFPMC